MDDLNWFTIKYDGRCAICDGELIPGMSAAYLQDELVGRCCEHEPVLTTPRYAEPQSNTRVIEVMPRGKTARDACTKCFIVHATSQVDCDG